MKYDYFYEEQAEQFVFYRVPKVLCTEDEYKNLSADAKLLYGLLLDRVSLSQKNGWVDGQGRIYVIFTLKQVMKSLCCADKKATRLLLELEEVGLIERKRQGKPTLIYVKNFIRSSIGRAKTRQNNDSGVVKTTNQDPSKQRCNNTDINNTEYNKTNLICSDKEDERTAYTQYFYKQLEMEFLVEKYPYQEAELKELFELIIDTVCSGRSSMQIAGDIKPLAVVRSQFMKLESSHIEYVMGCLLENTSKVRNMKQYLLSALYNAPLTMNNYYQAMYNNDRACGEI